MKTKIWEYRKKIGLTQEQLAKIVGIRRETLIHIEKGRESPTARIIWRLAKVFNVGMEDLVDYSDERWRPLRKDELRKLARK